MCEAPVFHLSDDGKFLPGDVAGKLRGQPAMRLRVPTRLGLIERDCVLVRTYKPKSIEAVAYWADRVTGSLYDIDGVTHMGPSGVERAARKKRAKPVPLRVVSGRTA